MSLVEKGVFDSTDEDIVITSKYICLKYDWSESVIFCGSGYAFRAENNLFDRTQGSFHVKLY